MAAVAVAQIDGAERALLRFSATIPRPLPAQNVRLLRAIYSACSPCYFVRLRIAYSRSFFSL